MGCPITLSQVSMPAESTTKWIVLGFAAFALVYVTFIRPQRKKNRKDPLAKPPGSSGLAQQRSVEREMSNLLVELSEMARQMTAQLDTRAAKLETLIREADDRIAAIKAATHGITTVPREDPPRDPEAFSSTAAAADDAEGAEAEPPPPPADVDPRHAAVYELADQGRSPHEIAQELGRPNGEIELILALRTGG